MEKSVFETTEDMEFIAQDMEFVAPEPEVEGNFGFYVDGYTLNGTDTVGEIRAIGPDGKSVVFPSRVLTSFLQRRLDPRPPIDYPE